MNIFVLPGNSKFPGAIPTHEVVVFFSSRYARNFPVYIVSLFKPFNGGNKCRRHFSTSNILHVDNPLLFLQEFFVSKMYFANRPTDKK